MGRIPAGNNLTIDVEADRWRLLANGDSTERVLVDAATGQPLRYVPTFGTRRRLPETGALPVDYIQRVVLGWSVKDEAWHLGLLLEPELAEARGSRWCEVAHWPDPERDLYGDIARQAGTTLAHTITRPFDVIPPRDGDAPLAPATLPSLPVTLDQWKLEQLSPTRLQFTLSSAWTRSKILRMVWYVFWAVIYIILSVTTLTARIAIPKPEFLPYLGLLSALVLLILAGNHAVQLLSTPNRYVVDGGAGAVIALKGSRERWRLRRGELQAVYVSHIVGRKSKRGKRTIHYGELNLLKQDGKFRSLFDHAQVEEKTASVDNAPAEAVVIPLNQTPIETNMQAAAAYIARTLTLPAYYDQRVK